MPLTMMVDCPGSVRAVMSRIWDEPDDATGLRECAIRGKPLRSEEIEQALAWLIAKGWIEQRREFYCITALGRRSHLSPEPTHS